MKKLLSLALVMLFGMTAFAQHYYEENFNDGSMPYGWYSAIRINGNLNENSWWLEDEQGFLYSYSGWKDTIGSNDINNVLLTPAFTLSLADTDGFLKFNVRTMTFDPLEGATNYLTIFVYRDNEDTPVRIEYSMAINSTDGVVKAEYDLGQLRNQLRLEEQEHDYQFIFRHSTTEGGESVLMLDNFKIGTRFAAITFGNEPGSGVTGSQDTLHVPYGRTFGVPGCTMEREGYVFIGWYTNDEDGEYWLAEGDQVAVEADMSWISRWGFNVTASFDANGGTGTQEDLQAISWNIVEEGDYYWPYSPAYSLPRCTMTKDGYYFAGWNTKADGTGKTYAAGDTIELYYDTTLYALWAEGRGYSIIYDGNGAYGATAGASVAEGSTYTIAANAFTKYNDDYSAECTFKGWNTEPDGTGTSYHTGQQITVTGELTLYAQWKCASTAGIQEPTAATLNVRIYPNPTHDIVHVNGIESARLEVLDLAGRTIRTAEQSNTISLQGLNNGLYMLRISTADGMAIRKVIKK
ncbi:MAG: InlB B-repeat-containing protein [Bacteroidales bacterium]|nr:InlB B-repeat-containing protein [Bacteroidales bacterium]